MQDQNKSDSCRAQHTAPSYSLPPPADDAIRLKNTIAWRDDGSRLFFDLSPAALSITTPDGRFIAVNPSFERLFGFTHKETQQQLITDLYRPSDDRERILDILKKDGKVRGFEAGLICKDAETRTMLVNVDWIVMNGTRFLFSSFQDITERRRAEEWLALQARILDETPASITVQDWQGSFLFANEKTFEIHGYTREEFFALNLSRLDAPASAELIEARIREIQEKGMARFEVRHFHKDGSTFPLEVYVRKANWFGIPAMLSIAIDITERKKYEQSLREARDAAEAASRAKTYFLANMSHEIRTPMNAIIGFAGLAMADAATSEQKRHLEIVSARSKDLLVLINDILDLSRIEADRLALEPQRFRFAETLNDVVSMFALAAEKKGIRLGLELSSGLCDAVYGDARRLRQVLVNLVGNAIKFTDSGSVLLRAEPDATEPISSEFTSVHIVVADTGIGIPRDRLNNIFEPFVQGNNLDAGNSSGTGLGLAICRGLARMMGGQIWCESEPGRGSKFHVVLRLARQTLEPDKDKADDVFQEKSARELNILVIEDDMDSRDLAMEFLRRQGHSSVGAANAREALEKLAVSDFDLVFMDIKMPGMSGLELTRNIRNTASVVRNHAVPVIALTAFAMKDDEQQCLDAGMTGYISKPLTPAALRQAITAAMGARSAAGS